MALNRNCIEYAGRKKNCSVSQKGKTFRIINNAELEITVYEVDSCLINNNHRQKCDYLFLINEMKVCYAYFIELKGTGLSDAIHQISSSVDILCKYLSEHKVFGRIVGKRVTPDIKSRRVKLDEKLKQFGGNLKIASAPELVEEV